MNKFGVGLFMLSLMLTVVNASELSVHNSIPNVGEDVFLIYELTQSNPQIISDYVFEIGLPDGSLLNGLSTFFVSDHKDSTWIKNGVLWTKFAPNMIGSYEVRIYLQGVLLNSKVFDVNNIGISSVCSFSSLLIDSNVDGSVFVDNKDTTVNFNNLSVSLYKSSSNGKRIFLDDIGLADSSTNYVDFSFLKNDLNYSQNSALFISNFWVDGVESAPCIEEFTDGITPDFFSATINSINVSEEFIDNISSVEHYFSVINTGKSSGLKIVLENALFEDNTDTSNSGVSNEYKAVVNNPSLGINSFTVRVYDMVTDDLLSSKVLTFTLSKKKSFTRVSDTITFVEKGFTKNFEIYLRNQGISDTYVIKLKDEGSSILVNKNYLSLNPDSENRTVSVGDLLEVKLIFNTVNVLEGVYPAVLEVYDNSMNLVNTFELSLEVMKRNPYHSVVFENIAFDDVLYDKGDIAKVSFVVRNVGNFSEEIRPVMEYNGQKFFFDVFKNIEPQESEYFEQYFLVKNEETGTVVFVLENDFLKTAEAKTLSVFKPRYDFISTSSSTDINLFSSQKEVVNILLRNTGNVDDYYTITSSLGDDRKNLFLEYQSARNFSFSILAKESVGDLVYSICSQKTQNCQDVDVRTTFLGEETVEVIKEESMFSVQDVELLLVTDLFVVKKEDSFVNSILIKNPTQEEVVVELVLLKNSSELSLSFYPSDIVTVPAKSNMDVFVYATTSQDFEEDSVYTVKALIDGEQVLSEDVSVLKSKDNNFLKWFFLALFVLVLGGFVYLKFFVSEKYYNYEKEYY